MPILLQMPSLLEQRLRGDSSDLEGEAREAFALDLYRRERITHHELGQMLGLDRSQTDAFLIERNEFSHCLTNEEIDEDRRVLEKVLKELGR